MKAPARIARLSPPIGGWDALSALQDMPAENAVQLENWFPSATDCTVRRGYIEWATGLPGAVDSLLVYEPASGTSKMFAVSGMGIYDVTGSGAVGAAVVTGLTNARWQSVQITNTGGHYLFACNGDDTPQTYDGAVWANSTITGPTIANLIWCNMHQGRLWTGEKNSLKAWYLPVNAIGGAAAGFDFTGLFTLGGYLVGMGTWTRDGGSGPDDLACFLSSEGEILLYSGLDPASATTWQMVGRFRIGRPLGRRCMIKGGADLVIMTQDGFVDMSSVLPVDRAQQSHTSITRQINPAVVTAARAAQSNFGWHAFIYPTSAMLIFNVPTVSGTFEQYVFNTITAKPCKFTGIQARCWGLLNDGAYFGGSTKVYLFDSGTTDAGADITATAVTAFNDYGSKGQKKNFRRVIAVMQSEIAPQLAVDMIFDYDTYKPLPAVTTPAQAVAVWDVAVWDQSLWGGFATFDEWRGVRGIGRVASIRVQSVSHVSRPSWVDNQITWIPGGMI